MAAFNWIKVEDVCAACGQQATLRCQTHVASSYGGDADGRFFDEVYSLGEKMRWFERGHRDYWQWRNDGRVNPDDDMQVDEEACYSDCLQCGADIVVVVRFRDLVPVEVVSISREDEWPAGYY